MMRNVSVLLRILLKGWINLPLYLIRPTPTELRLATDSLISILFGQLISVTALSILTGLAVGLAFFVFRAVPISIVLDLDALSAKAIRSAVIQALVPFLLSVLVGGTVAVQLAVRTGRLMANGQVDALETMGADPYRYLAYPTIFGLALAALPITAWGTCCTVMSIGVVTDLLLPSATPYILETLPNLLGSRDLIWGAFQLFLGTSILVAMACTIGSNGRARTGWIERSGSATFTWSILVPAAIVVLALLARHKS